MAADDKTPAEAAVPGRTDTSDVTELGYEEARDELVAIVARLEGGQLELEESMRLWERGEALAAHCGTWLDRAEERLEAAAERRADN
ncbi:MAG TPA: exodeoxyribonuclease VII small subunit [Segeticoccus sp.]|uniref:exodeoxyribonuclease VII small subunit n=1 Tax=Segeticoccus sp. TaxID=2706531 RepID=UPI002D7F9CB1|nr:exodeoxyribonuclease VII small subunit [Segeticoccus sp.]HET8599216.1 exodeoxyribonuclease VII small subunit [Segeticoccus sp.]